MKIVNPNIARRGSYIDTFTTKKKAEEHGESLEKILRETRSSRELVLTYVLGKPGGKRTKWQIFLL